ncbi:MAG: electron transfer flavoprotein subunit beta/FixA family protein [Elusimicrobia bacterium]|nr:electron transfer flavoprotein subunit beta/FixA family protein [Elusimicrobiota bacterium]
MRICVLLKQVPDTSARLQAVGLEPLFGGCLPVVNPYDEFALEAALRLRESGAAVHPSPVPGGPGGPEGSCEIVLVTLCAAPVEEAVFHGLAMGADRAVVAEPSSGARWTPLETGRVLAEVLKTLGPDLVFCGEKAADDEAAQVGPIVAEALGVAQVCGVESAALELPGPALRARCRRGNSFHEVSCGLPCVATFLRGPALPRYPSMADIFSAKEKPVHRIPVSPARVSALRRVSLTAPPEERGRKMIRGGAREAAQALLDLIDRSVDCRA